MTLALGRAFRCPVTTGIGLMAVVGSTLRWVGEGDFSSWTMGPSAVGAEPWRLLTACLLHADLLHLAFNLYWLWLLGTRVESTLGATRVALGYLVVGAGASAAQWALSTGGIGLSGIGYGLFGFLWVASRRDPRFRGAMPQQTTRLFVGWFFVCIALTVLGLLHIGNVAHGSGAVLGALFGLAGLERYYQRKLRMAGVAGLMTVVALIGLGAMQLRPWINFGPPGQAHAEAAWALLAEGDPNVGGAAVDLYREALDQDESVANWWYNYGVALQRSGDYEASVVAYERALSLEPTAPAYRSAVASWRARRAFELSGDVEEAIELYRGAIDLDDTVASWWYGVGVALTERGAGGDHQAADTAYERAFALDPTSANYRNAVARSRARRGYEAVTAEEYGQAIELYRGALELEPDHPVWWVALSLAFQETGQHAEARRAGERAHWPTGEPLGGTP